MSLENKKSAALYHTAEQLMPGGVNSPVRSFNAVEGSPVFIESARGTTLVDVDGNSYVDFMASWGPLILGHADPDVVSAIQNAALKGTSYGAPCSSEIELAEIVVGSFPSIDMVRMTSSGTEATMSAVRLSRAYTERDLIVKFEGCYHGHADYLLVKAGSGATTFGTPSSPGVPEGFTANTLLAHYNDLSTVEALFAEHGENIASVILEPVAGNMGVVPPKEGFLQGLRDITHKHGSLLIFDEVITGFRLGASGAQGTFGVTPDITCLGKIIGGGLPVGAYGGKKEIMSMVAPIGPVYQAGTLSGNPLAMAAGVTSLNKLMSEENYSRLEEMTSYLVSGLRDVIKTTGTKASINTIGSMFTIFFADHAVFDYETALASDVKKYGVFFKKLLDAGIMFPPSQFETVFVSLAHTEKELDYTIQKIGEILA